MAKSLIAEVKTMNLTFDTALDGWDNGPTTKYWNVQMCNENKYCCRPAGEREDCCNNATAIKTRNGGIGMPLAQNSTGAATIASCGSNSKLVAVGAGVGAPLAALLVTAVAGLVFMRRKQQKLHRQLADAQGSHVQGSRKDEVWEKPELGPPSRTQTKADSGVPSRPVGLAEVGG